MHSDQPVMSVPVTLGFDPAVLQVVSVSEGDFLSSGGASTTYSQRIDPAGRVQVTTSRAKTMPGATSPGSVVNLSVKALATTAESGGAQLQVLSATPLGALGQPVGLAPPAPLTVSITR